LRYLVYFSKNASRFLRILAQIMYFKTESTFRSIGYIVIT
jgi:hypothetical protein